jgi:hypothetical protein
MNRQERRAKSVHQRDRCGVCGGSLRGGLTRRIGGGPVDGLTGHVDCIDFVVQHPVAKHGMAYLGDVQVDP